MTSFPEDYFYLRAGSTNLVLDVERSSSFFGFGASSVKEGSKTVIASQKSEAENDAAYQLWRHENNGYLVNKQTNLYLEVDNGKVGNRILLHHQKSGAQGANQRWALTKEGYISLKSHPKYVIDVKGANLKDATPVVLTDSTSKSFGKSNAAKWEVVSLSKKRRNEGAIGIIRLELVEAKGLKSVDSFFAGGKSDPYVRVFHEGGQDIIAQTKFIDNNLDPVWNEVHYLPVKNIGDKFILDVMDFNAFTKDKPLGHCTFEVTKELVKEVSSNVYEGTPNGIDRWANLSIQGKLHYRAKFFPLNLNALPKPTADFLANLKEKPFDKSTLYILITLQSPNGSFPSSNTLANLFGYSDTEELFNLYKLHVHDERVLNNTNKTIWTTSMVLWFLRYLLKEHRSEWGSIYERSERYITKELGGDLEIEEIVIASGRKAVRERFEIKVVDDKQIITREHVKAHDITRVIRHQTNNGAFQASDELAKLLSFNSSGQLRTALTRHINSQSKNAKITNYETQVWVTILVLYYFRLVGVDHKTEWEESYLKAYKWVWGQFKGKEKIEQEAFKIIESFVKERYSVKDDVLQLDEQFIIHITDKIDFIKKGGVSVSRGISAKKLYGVARIHIVSAKNLMKADSWFGGGASDPYVKIIGLSSGEVYGETRVIYNNINPEWNQVFYIPIYDINDKVKLQICDYNAFFKHVTLGTYVLDLKDFIKVLSNGAVQGKKLDTTCELRPNKGKLHFIADFHSYSEQDHTTTVISKTTITIQHLYILITYQRPDGGFELNDKLAKLLNYNSKDELVKAFTSYIEKENDDKVKALHIDTWGTALITAFLKTLLWEHRHEWMTTYTKAETYLSEVVTDIETEEKLYTLANRFIIERFKITEWASEEQKKSLGVIVQSKRMIITRRTVTIRHVRRFMSYQKESGCFELDNHLAETLGFSSTEEAKKSLEAHFSSYSKVSKLDVNLYSSAIMVWFIRYVLVDFRGEWVDKYQSTAKWITEQVKDKQTEEELLEAARSFVRKRFDVDDEAMKEDETFESTLAINPDNIPSDIKRKIEEDEIKNENDAIVTDQVIGLLKIKIKGARNLPKSSSWFTSSKPDPYIKILDASGQEIVRTRTISETIEPKWDEAHYVSIHGTGESITFDIMDENLFVADRPLGAYVFETAKIVKKSEDGSYDSSEPVREWFPLVIGKKPSGELDMEVQFVSTVYKRSETFVFKRDTITIEHIYVILSWRNSRGYFEYSDDVSYFFNYKSLEELKSDFLKYTSESTELQSLSESALSTALIITYLKILCWKYREEWKKVSAHSEEWLSSEVNNIEVEDKLYEICEKFIIEKFDIKDFEEEQKIDLIITKKRVVYTRKLVTIRVVRRILACQTQENGVPLNNKTAELLGFENAEELKKELQTYFKSESVKKVEHLWASACIIYYLRYVALDYRHDWIKSFEKTSDYLRTQCKDSKLEKEVLDCAKEFIRNRYQVDKESIEEDNKFAVTLSRKEEIIQKEKDDEDLNEARVKRKPSLLVQPDITAETVNRYIKCQSKEGKFTLNEDIARELSYENVETFKTSINKHFGSKLTSKHDADTLATAISIYYLRLVYIKHRPEWSSTYEKSCKWLKQQVKDEEAERELLKAAKSYVIITYNVDDETIETDSKEFAAIPAVPSVPTTHETAAAPDKGKTAEKEQKHVVSESQRKTVLDVQSSTTVEKTKSIISYQQGNGCYKLSDVVSKKLEVSEETLTETIRTSTTNETIRKLTPDVLSTVLTISYLQTFANQHESHWKTQNEQARKYLIKEVGEDKVEEILAESKKIVVERATNKVIRKQQRTAFATVQSSTTLEKTKSILSSFKSDHFEWNQTISKKLNIPNDKFVSTCESYAQTEELKRTIKENPTVWQTAIQLHYLEQAAPHHEQHWRVQYNTARKYIKSQIKDEKLEKEIWEATHKLCTEKVTQKVIVKKRRVALLRLQSKTTPQTAKVICSKQKPEGSIEISEEITKNCGITSDSVLKTVETYTTTEELKKVDVDVWKTAISLNYLENYCTANESTWKPHHEKARKFIKEKVKDEKLEAEILRASKEIVIQKSTTNVIRKQVKKEKRETLSHLDKKTSPSTVISIVSKQKSDGSIELSTDLKDQLEITSSESLVTSIESHGVSDKLKKVINSKDTKLVESALTISYLQNAAPSQERNWRPQYDKAIEYIRKEVKDVKLEEELLNVCKKHIVQKNITKVVRKKQLKEKRIALTAAQSKTTVETTKKIVSAQKSDGSFELNEEIGKQLDVTSPETLLNTCHTVTTDERVKTVKDSSIWTTAMTLVYLQYNASSHESTWKEQYDRARKYLTEKVNDTELEEEILKTTKTVVVEKVNNKVIREQKKEEKRTALSVIQSKTDIKTIKAVKSLQKSNGSFELCGDVAKQIDISSKENLTNTVLTYTTNETLKKHIKDEKYGKAIETAITVSYLKVHGSANEESEEYKKARKYLKEQINDDALEEEIIKTCSKLVIDKSTKKVIEKKKKADKRVTLSEIRKVGSTEKVQSIVSNQKSDGSIELSDTTRKDLNINNETLKVTVNTLTKNKKLKKAPVSVWNTAISLNYLKVNSDELGGAFKDKYEKARNYLKTQLGGDEEAEEEILKVTNKIVVDKVVLKQTEAEKQKALAVIQSKTNEKTIKTVVSTQQQDGSFELSDVVCKDLDITSEETVITTMKNYVSSEKLKKINNKKLFHTVITIAYLETTSSAQDSQWKDKYEKARKYIREVIKDEDLEEEILQSSRKFVIESSTNTVRKQDKQDKKIEKNAALITLKTKTTPETLKKIVSTQSVDGSFKLDKTVSDQINVSSDNIQSSIKTYNVSKSLQIVPNKIWETALSLRYLTITSQSQDQHQDQTKKAKEYLIKELKDEKLVEEVLTTSEKIIVEKSVEKEKKDTVATIQNSTTAEKAKEIVSSQNNDGSLQLTDTVSKEIGTESTDTIVSYVKSYFVNKKVPENKKLIDTAITLSYLKKTTSTDTSPELKEKCEKAENYLKAELGSEEVVKDLLETTETVVVENVTKKVAKEKATQVVEKEIQETVTEEEITEVIEIQNNEGSYEKISDKITEKLGVTTTENISSSVRITDERVKNFDTKVWNTFITIAYCNKVLGGKHKPKLTAQNEKAITWLNTQIKDEKLVKEVLESCEKVVIEKASSKKKEKKESSWLPTLPTSSWTPLSGWGSYLTGTVKSATDSVSHVTQLTADTVTSTLVNLKSKTTSETTKKIVDNQNADGSIKLDKTVTEQIKISPENIQSSIQTYKVSEKLQTVPKSVWETALSLRYLTITSQSQDQHQEQTKKAKEYLIKELGDEKLVEEVLTTSDKIIVEKSVEKEKEDAVTTVQGSTTTEKVKEIVSSQKADGSIELTDHVSDKLGVESKESLVTSIRTYFGNKIPDNKKLLDTAITLSFLRKTSSTDTSPELKEKYKKAEEYLKTELGSEEKIKELLETTDTIVVDHATKKVIKEKADQVIVEEVQETVTEEEITEVIEIQNNEGSYEKISDKITEKLGVITTENISSSVRITDERVKKFDTKVWNTFITIAYCNKVLGKHKPKLTAQNEKAIAWLNTQIKDEKLVKEVLESCEKVVVEKASNKKKESSSWSLPALPTVSTSSWTRGWGSYLTGTVKSATDSVSHATQLTADTVTSTLVNLKSKTTPETTKKIVDNQNPDGSIKLDKTVTEQIKISPENIQSSIQTYKVSEKLKSVPKSVWETALSLRYLTITSQSQDQHQDQTKKAKEYLIKELGDETLVEEVLTTSDKIIVEKSVEKEKEDAVGVIQGSTTTEKVKEIVSSQKDDGSLELPDTVSKELDAESNESLVTSIKTYFGSKLPDNKKLYDTALTLSFLRKTSSTDTSPELKEKYKKAEKYLKAELGSEEKIKELLETTDTVVVDHATKKVIKDKANQTVVEEIQETVTEEETIKVIEIQDKEGSYEKISDKITEKLGVITPENISSSVRVTDERVKNFDTKVWNTFITIAYCNKVLGKHKPKLTAQNEKAITWLNAQIKDEKLVKEVLESCEKVVVEKATSKKKESSPLSNLSKWIPTLPTWSDTTTVKKIESTPVPEKPKDTPSTGTPSTSSPATHPKKDTQVTQPKEQPKGTPSTGTPSSSSPATHPKKDTQVTQPKEQPKEQPKGTPSTGTPSTSSPATHPKKDTQVTQPKEQPEEQPKKDRPTPSRRGTAKPDNVATSVVKLSKDIEDAITWGEKDDDDHSHEKVDALDTVKTSSKTKEVIEYVVSEQNDDGSIGAGETVCDQLDAPSEEKIVTTIQQSVTTEKLKNAKPTWITTAVNIAYLENLADQHEDEWKEKREKAREYLIKEIGNPKDVDELINASTKYVVKQTTQKVIADKKKAAVLAIRSITSEDTVNDALSSQKNDGSFEISKTVTKELNNASPEDLVDKAKSYVKSDKIKPENSDSIFKTALMLGYLRTATTDTDSPSNKLSKQYEQARKYLSSQIGDAQLEEDIIKASSKVIIDKSSEKVEEESKKEALKEIQITPEITKTIVSTQKNDGSFEVSEEITNKLNSTSPNSLVTSIKTYTKNEKLKNVHPSVWQTVISMQYLKNTASQNENDWKDQYNQAEKYIRSQLKDDNLVNELLVISNKYVIDRVTREIVKQREERTLQVRKSIFDEDTKNTTISILKEEYKEDDVRSICSSQKEDGSITLHYSIKNQLNVGNTKRLITNVKSYISNQHLRTYNDSIFETALTIYILKYVLVDYKGEPQTVCERASSWLSKQLNNNKELEKELFDACEQYVIEEGSKKIEHVIVEEIEKVRLEVSEETRRTVLEYLQFRSIKDDAQLICTSQNGDGSFTLHSSILEQFKISSIDEFVKGITRYVGIKNLKNCEKSIWQTLFTITYFKYILVDYESEWRNVCEKANKWVVSKNISKEEMEELNAACDQYLIEKGVEAYNNQTINVSVTKLDVDEKTKTTIFNGLRSDAKVDHARSLCKSQHNNGTFTLHKIISDQLKISSPEEAVETLKTYVGSLRLRRLDKSLWITAFIVTYFKIVLVEHESEWRTSCDRASAWISEQVHNSDLEAELYSACEQYLIQQGCEFINSKNTTTKVEERGTTLVTEVLNKPSHSAIYGSDGRVVTQKEPYLNSELIVAGAAARAKCKVKLDSTQNKTLEDVSKATELALKYTEEEVNRLFANNVTHGNKDDVLNRAKRATKFLMDEYYKPGGDCC